MRVCVLAGGVGSARFLTGLVRVLDPTDITVVVNTGDDERIRGLHVSPDIDTVLYHLANVTDWERGWGLDEESFVSDERYRDLVANVESDVDMHDWFALGDRDLATHLFRTRLLDADKTLTEATDALRRGLRVGCTVLPMSDSSVRTVLTTSTGERLDFQTYFVQRRHADDIVAVEYVGADRAAPAPGVIDALTAADVVFIPPSNPVLSIGPLLAITDIRRALEGAGAKRIGVSPLVGGRAIKGPADRVLGSMGYEVSPIGIHRYYEGLLDVLAVDSVDSAVPHPGSDPRWVRLDTVMSGPDDAAVLAKALLDA